MTTDWSPTHENYSMQRTTGPVGRQSSGRGSALLQQHFVTESDLQRDFNFYT
jgi:hypothetical protein